MNEVKIEIPSLPENIRVVESFIDNAQEKYAFGEDMYGNVMVSITEAVNNAIIHGNKSNSSVNVILTLQMEDDKITFLVEDKGDGFDYENLPDPTSPENLEKVGGRGIFLMRNLCDEVTFHDDGRKVELTFQISHNGK